MLGSLGRDGMLGDGLLRVGPVGILRGSRELGEFQERREVLLLQRELSASPSFTHRHSSANKRSLHVLILGSEPGTAQKRVFNHTRESLH